MSRREEFFIYLCAIMCVWTEYKLAFVFYDSTFIFNIQTDLKLYRKRKINENLFLKLFSYFSAFELKFHCCFTVTGSVFKLSRERGRRGGGIEHHSFLWEHCHVLKFFLLVFIDPCSFVAMIHHLLVFCEPFPVIPIPDTDLDGSQTTKKPHNQNETPSEHYTNIGTVFWSSLLCSQKNGIHWQVDWLEFL